MGWLMELLLSRIICGYLVKRINDYTLELHYPDLKTQYESNIIYEEIISDKYSHKDRELLSIQGRTWDGNKESELTKVNEELEDLKIDLYNNYYKPSRANQVKVDIERNKQELETLLRSKSKFDNYSVEGIAENARLAFCVEKCTFKNGKVYDWADWQIQNAVEYWVSNMIMESQIRELARSREWTSVFSPSKSFGVPVFPCSAVEMNTDQRRLINWSLIYYNVQQLPDPPDENIVADDDAFDGYLLLKAKERKEKTKSNLSDSLISSDKVRQSEEAYIVVKDAKEAARVYDTNDGYGNSVKTARFEQFKQGNVKHGALSDIKFRAKLELNKARKK
jgi:hypothetical protein